MFTFCGGLVVIALTFTFDILSLNPAEAYSFDLFKILWKGYARLLVCFCTRVHDMP